MKAKKLVTLISAIALIAALAVGGTLAYLVSETSISNVFTAGKVTATLDEKVVNEYGEPLDENGKTEEEAKEEAKKEAEDAGEDWDEDNWEWEPADRTSDDQEYTLIPGHEYVKDPTVHIEKGSEACYVIIAVSNIEPEWESDEDDYTTIAKQIEKNEWNKIDTSKTRLRYAEDGYTYYWKYVDKEEADENAKEPEYIDLVIFSNFKVGAQATPTDGKIDVKVTVTQADGFEDAVDAWNKVYPPSDES
jgi:predicted ribosomally synthesized peptide with SipW-like signal peptide